MRRTTVVGVLLLFSVTALTVVKPVPADEVGDTLKRLSARADKMLVKVICTVKSEVGSRTMAGTGVCLDAGQGLFMTLALDVKLRPKTIAGLKLVAPGTDRKSFDAELLGMDPITGLSFLRTEGEYGWVSISFLKSGRLSLGDPVFSLGLNAASPAAAPVLGQGYVAGVYRRPGRVVFVTGGSLPGPGSIVLNAAGKGIGLVQSQPFERYTMLANNKKVTIPLKSMDRSLYFVPVEEFAGVLRNIPTGGKARRLKWIGVGVFRAVGEDLLKPRGVDFPAVMVDNVIPGGPADEAGMKDRDIIVSVNGEALEKLATPALVSRNFARRLFGMRGQKVRLGVYRDAERKEFTVALEPMPELPSEAKRIFDNGLGILMRETVMLDRYLGDAANAGAEGLVVVAVNEKKVAARVGIRPGDVVTAVNDKTVRTARECKAVLDETLGAKTPGDLRITCMREGEEQVYTIKVKTAEEKK